MKIMQIDSDVDKKALSEPLELTDKNIELHPACVDSLTVINEYGV